MKPKISTFLKLRSIPLILLSLFCLWVIGCSTSSSDESAESHAMLPFGYTPLNPLPVSLYPTNPPSTNILSALPNETVQLAVGQYMKDGGITYGTESVGYAGNTYNVVLDYMKYIVRPLRLNEHILVSTNKVPVTKLHTFLIIFHRPRSEDILEYTTNITFTLVETNSPHITETSTNFAGNLTGITENETNLVVVPVFVGIGVRLTAQVTVSSGSVSLNYSGIGAAAVGTNVTGSLVIQSLGLSGEAISPVLPIPSDVSSTTIQNALVSLGTIKAKIYSSTDLNFAPQVLGILNTSGWDQQAISGITGCLLNPPTTLNVQPGEYSVH